MWLIISCFATFCALISAVLNLRSRSDYWKKISRISGEPTLPFVGNAHQIGAKSKGVYKSLHLMWKKHGRRTFRVVLGWKAFVVISTPENVEAILSSNDLLDKQEDYDMLRPWLGNGLLTSTGSIWHRQRKIITPTFHFRILENFVSIFNETSEKLVARLTAHAGAGDFDVQPYAGRCTLDGISQTAMGVNTNCQDNLNCTYIQAVKKISLLIHKRMFSLLKRNDSIYYLCSDYWEQRRSLKIIHEFVKKVIQQRREELSKKIDISTTKELTSDNVGFDEKRKVFLDLLLLSQTANGQPLSDETILDETNTFMFEGHDTTSSAITFTIHSLALNPNIQQLVYEEQKNILGHEIVEHLKYKQLQEMKYLERVIKEVLRLYPSVPLIGRLAKQEFLLPDGTLVPAGTNLTIVLPWMHINEKYFPDPLKFDPDRHLIENSRDKSPFAYIPFSAGHRNCIGQKFAMLEMKVILSKVLQRFEILPPAKEQKLRCTADMTLKSANGVNIRLRTRTKQLPYESNSS